MKKLIISLVAAAAALTGFSAAAADNGLSANQQLVGYTVTDNVDISGAVFGTPGTYTVGAMLDPGNLSFYKSCKVVGVRMNAAVELGRTRVFINSVNADNEMEEIFAQRQKIYEGWNNIFFNGEGYEITGDNSLFFGFDYEETAEMLAAEKGGISSVGYDTSDSFLLYLNNNLYPVTGVGKLCVQLIVDVTNLPSCNMQVSYLDTGFKYKKKGETIEMYTIVRNVGRDEITGFTMGIQTDDEEPIYVDVEASLRSGETYDWQYNLPLPADFPTGAHSIRVFVAKANGETLPVTDNNAQSVTYAIYENSLKRNKVYMEVYTSQNLLNSYHFNKLIPLLRESAGDLFCLAHVHQPSTSLAVEDANYLHDLYAYTLPSFTVNRAFFPGETHIAYDFNDYYNMLPENMMGEILSEIVMQDFYNPCFAGIDVSVKYNPDNRELSIHVEGDLLPEAKAIYGDLAVTVLLTEDGVIASQKILSPLGREKDEKNYEHSDVLRGFVTSPLGDKLEITGDNYSVDLKKVIPADWTPGNLNVIAFLTKAGTEINAFNCKDYDILNANNFKVEDTSAVEEVAVPDAERSIEGFYSLDGLKVDREKVGEGLYIIRYSAGTSRKVMIRK